MHPPVSVSKSPNIVVKFKMLINQRFIINFKKTTITEGNSSRSKLKKYFKDPPGGGSSKSISFSISRRAGVFRTTVLSLT